MAKTFDLRKQLKLHDNGLLQQLFVEEPAMADVPWDSLGAHNVEPIVAAWETMEDDRRRHHQVVLHDVNELADPRGLKVLLEELEWQCPDRLQEFQALKSPADKALWAYPLITFWYRVDGVDRLLSNLGVLRADGGSPRLVLVEHRS